MRELTLKREWIVLLLFIFMVSGPVVAQPSANRLADDILQKNAERLSQIETLEMTIEMEGMAFLPEMTTRYIKKVENGVPYLEIDSADYDSDYGTMSGTFDDTLARLVRGSSSITRETLGSYNTYKVYVDDQELLRSLDEGEIEFDEMEMEAEAATIWIDTDQLYVRKLLMEQSVDGDGMSVEMILNDYREYSGMPLAHTIEMKIHGINSQFSEEDIAEARKAMEEMERQLAQMPEAQRNAIERQLKPQIEQFEQMIDGGEPGSMVLRVTNVKVNQ
jgi:hypothetical protein